MNLIYIRTIFLIFISFFSLNQARAVLTKNFIPGTGASYKMTVQGQGGTNVSIYVVKSSENEVSMEYFIENKSGLLPIEMWQQFEIAVGAHADVKSGYLLVKELKNPEKIPPEYLRGAEGGVQVNDFIFKGQDELDKNKVASEELTTPAGKVMANHYKVQNNGQIVEYWISDKVLPLGLVKLISKGDKAEQNYQLELSTLLKGVGAKINPALATALSDVGKAYLAKPQGMR